MRLDFENYLELLSGLEMENKLISSIMMLSVILAFSLFILVGFYTSFFEALGILTGTAWGCINIYFLKKLLEELLKIGSRNGLKFYTMIGIKFPLLYLMGYGILKWNLFPLLTLVLGFSLIFIAIFLIGLTTLFTRQENIGSKPS